MVFDFFTLKSSHWTTAASNHQKTKIWHPPKKRFLHSLRSDFHELLFGIFFSDTSPFMEDLPTCIFSCQIASSHGWKPKKYPVWKGSSSEPTLLIFQELEPLIDGLINYYLFKNSLSQMEGYFTLLVTGGPTLYWYLLNQRHFSTEIHRLGAHFSCIFDDGILQNLEAVILKV